MTAFFKTVYTVFRKEMWEHFKTWRLIVIGGIFAFVFIVLSLYGGILMGQGSAQPSYKAGANSVLGLVLAFTSFFPGLMAIVISYTSIVGERSKKSLILLVSKPVKRPALFAGKFLSSYFAIVLVYMVVMTAGYLGVVAASAKVPSLEEVGRAYGAVAFVLLTMACWVVFAMFLSSVLKNPITVAVSAIMIWFLVMPIVSQVGLIYWMVSSSWEQQPPNGVGVSLIPQGQGAMVVFSGAAGTEYTFYNETGPVQGYNFQGIYTLSGVPPGNYSWTAKGAGVNRSGTLVVDGLQGLSIAYDGALTVSAPAAVNITLEKDGRTVQPSENAQQGPMVNLTYKGNLGTCALNISFGAQLLFSGSYELTVRDSGPFSGGPSGPAPDYVKYDQLLNPDSAMTGYQKVLDPNSRSDISPSEGATALFLFFMTFLILGLLAFSKLEMT